MKRPWMPLYIEDYRGATARLNAAQHGAYLLLIMEYWHAGNLPSDEKQLARIACMSDAEWKKNREVISHYFEPGWKHARVEKEIKHAAEVSEARKQARSKRGNKTPTIVGTIDNTLHTPQVDVDEDARATPGVSITPEAFALSEKLIAAAGWDRDEPHAMGTPWTAQKWLNGNWNPDLCVATVQRVKAAARKKINTLAYFEAAIAEAHAQQAAPLPTVIIDQHPEVIHAPSQRPRNNWQASRDAGRDAYADLQAFNAQHEGGEDDGTIVELLPASRRG